MNFAERYAALGCLVVLLCSCGEVSQENPEGSEGGACYKNGTCDPGLKCLSNTCVKVPDGGMPDMRLDVPVADLPVADTSIPDQNMAEGSVPDAPALEATVPDGPLLEATVPDGPVLEATVPDGPLPDLVVQLDIPPPDKTVLPDQAVVTPAKWVTVKAGTFQMGSPSSESCRQLTGSLETQHKVTLSHDFSMLEKEVSQSQFNSLMGYNPSTFKSCGNHCPVEQVNWHEAAAYCNALSAKEGYPSCYSCSGSGKSVTCKASPKYLGKAIYLCAGYRMPTEAEWEYAYRAGTTGAYYSGTNTSTLCQKCGSKEANLASIGWYCNNAAVSYSGCVNNSGKGGPTCAGPSAGGMKQANKWGLYDLAGSVWEWCHDGYQKDLGSANQVDPSGVTSSSRVLRGGSWDHEPHSARAAYRGYDPPANRGSKVGFRPVRTIFPKPLAHWRLDEGTGKTAKDSSGNGHSGTIKGGAAWSNGVWGKALVLDGVNDHAVVKHAASLNVTKFTQSLWLKVEKFPSNSVDIFSKRGAAQTDGPTLILYANGQIRFHWEVSNTNYGMLSKTLLLPGKWYHLAGTYDGASARFYVNGVQDSSALVTTNPPAVSNDIVLGSGESMTNYFAGSMDDVRLYGSALTAGQVYGLYNAASSCSDGVKNGHETDVDCGGSMCNKCADTIKCGKASDCLSGVCTGGKCLKGCSHQPVGKSCQKDAAGAEWCSIPGGCFKMGSPSGEKCREPSSPKETEHQVTLTRDFEIQGTEVTQTQFNKVMGYNPSKFSTCTTCPVEQVTWHESAAYCNALSQSMGLATCYACTGSKSATACKERGAYAKSNLLRCPGYRLPTEAEWEYAYRAGTTSAFYNGGVSNCTTDSNASQIGWYNANSGAKTQPVAKRLANAWGLYDMAGNTQEWVNDVYLTDLGSAAAVDPFGGVSGVSKVQKGGAWKSDAGWIRAAYRKDDTPTPGYHIFGFRCVRTRQTEPMPLGYWRFNEGNGTTTADASGNGNSGAVTGATWTPNSTGNALSFSSASTYVDIKDSGALSGMRHITVAAWIKLKSFGIAGEGAYVVSKDLQGDGTDSTDSFALVAYKNKTGDKYVQGAIGAGGLKWAQFKVPTIQFGRWYHLAMTYDGKMIRLYLDGAEVATQAQTGAINKTTSVPLRIGQTSGKDRHFDGLIDEVRLYDYTLSPHDIGRLAAVQP